MGGEKDNRQKLTSNDQRSETEERLEGESVTAWITIGEEMEFASEVEGEES